MGQLRRVLGLAAGMVALIVLSATGAGSYGTSSGTVGLSSPTVAPGGSTTLSGTGFAASVTLTATLYSAPVTLGSTTTTATGSYTLTVVIPANTPAGAHTIVVSGPAPDGGTATASTPLTVSGSASSTGSSNGLPLTGAQVRDLTSVAVVLLLVGGLLVVTVRRRRV